MPRHREPPPCVLYTAIYDVSSLSTAVSSFWTGGLGLNASSPSHAPPQAQPQQSYLAQPELLLREPSTDVLGAAYPAQEIVRHLTACMSVLSMTTSQSSAGASSGQLSSFSLDSVDPEGFTVTDASGVMYYAAHGIVSLAQQASPHALGTFSSSTSNASAPASPTASGAPPPTMLPPSVYLLVLVSRFPIYGFLYDSIRAIRLAAVQNVDVQPFIRFVTTEFAFPESSDAENEGEGPENDEQGRPVTRKHAACATPCELLWDPLGLEIALDASPICGGTIPFPLVNDAVFGSFVSALSGQTLLRLFEALLCEERVVVVSSSPSLLAPVMEAVKSLIFPLVWQGIFIPNLSKLTFHKVFQSTSNSSVPFLLGVTKPYSVEDVVARLGSVSKRRDASSALATHVLDLESGVMTCHVGSERTHRLPISICSTLAVRLEKRHSSSSGQRLAFFEAMLELLCDYRSHLTSWSSGNARKKETGFDVESFLTSNPLAQMGADNVSFLKTVVGTRAFGDFATRSSAHATSPIDRLSKAWMEAAPKELPSAARDLLMQRCGYTLRGASAVWARVCHLSTNELQDLFSSKRFRDFLSELGVPLDGGDYDEDISRSAVVAETCLRPYNEMLLQGSMSRRATVRSSRNVAFHRVFSMEVASNNAAVPILNTGHWLPPTNHSVHLTRASARLTYFCTAERPSEDDIASWRSHLASYGRPRVQLAFSASASASSLGGAPPPPLLAVGDSQSGQSTASSSTSSSVPERSSSWLSQAALPPKQASSKQVVTKLACAMKWTQLQYRRLALDVSEMLFGLVVEERTRHQLEMRSQRRTGPQQQVPPRTSSLSITSLFPPSPPVTPMAESSGASPEVAALQAQLRQREGEIEMLRAQLRIAQESSPISQARVRRTAPLVFPTNILSSPSGVDRIPSPTPSISSSTSTSNLGTYASNVLSPLGGHQHRRRHSGFTPDEATAHPSGPATTPSMTSFSSPAISRSLSAGTVVNRLSPQQSVHLQPQGSLNAQQVFTSLPTTSNATAGQPRHSIPSTLRRVGSQGNNLAHGDATSYFLSGGSPHDLQGTHARLSFSTPTKVSAPSSLPLLDETSTTPPAAALTEVEETTTLPSEASASGQCEKADIHG